MVVECLLGTCEVPGSVPSTTKNTQQDNKETLDTKVRSVAFSWEENVGVFENSES